MSASLPTFARSCRQIVCVGRNYAAHAKELGNAVPSEPVLFLKPPSSLLPSGRSVLIPRGLDEVHHEVELGVIIGKKCSHVTQDTALSYVKGYFIGLDITARQLQQKAKTKGLPWSVSKGYDTFGPVSEMIPVDEIDPNDTTLWCQVDGKETQRDTTAHMLFPVATLISHISSIFTLHDNDLIFTGTPSGVSALTHGSTVSAGLTTVSGKTVSIECPVRSAANL